MSNESVVPSAKDRKYDRQLRLWASSGQKSLEEAHICLVGATALGSELVKNLVLPGIGKLTVTDNQLVTEEDLCNNFFVTDDDVGKNRAQVVEGYVKELNPDVETRWVGKKIEELLKEVDFWSQFSLVIACDVNPDTLVELNGLLYDQSIALMVADCIGFYGYVRVSKPEHTIVELHPESLVDLRLTTPWEELIQFAQSFDLDRLNGADLAHVPYVVLLLIYLDKYKQQNDGKLPSTFAEKKALRQMINDDAVKVKDDPQNFEQAAGAVLRTIQSSNIPQSLQDMIESCDESSFTSETSEFWILVAALKRFVSIHNELPQPGVLPDMKADTKSFIRLQTIYRDLAKKHADILAGYVNEITSQCSHAPIATEVVETFCKNARYIRAIAGTKLSQTKLPANASTSEPNDLIHRYIGIQAYKLFVQRSGEKCPADLDNEIKVVTSQLGCDWSEEGTQKVIQEIVRSQGVELHNIAAFLGGVGGQEAIKLLTSQYGALDNTVVYDGIQCTTSTYKL